MIKAIRQRRPRICQGDIFRDVDYIEYVSEESGDIEVSRIVFPLVIVLTQDCDLEQDYRFRWARSRNSQNHDKWLISILVAPLYNVEHVYQGDHLSELGLKMQTISKGKTPGRNLVNNETPRYHYIEFPPTVPLVPSVIDFKHYFSVNVKYLKKLQKTHFVCRVSYLYREDISQRFAGYFARIALP